MPPPLDWAAASRRTVPRRTPWVLLALLGLSACEKPSLAEEAAPPPPVHVDEVVLGPRATRATGTAELRPLRRATLSAEAPGRVVFLSMERGQHVEAGHILLRLDVGRTAVAAGVATANVRQAEAALEQAQRERELSAQLVRSGSASRRSLEQSDDATVLAGAALEAARAQAQLTRRGLTEAILRAPFAGTVVERGVELGEYVGPGGALGELMDASVLRAEVLLDPREALDTQAGARVRAAVFARPGERFEGEVVRLGEAVDRQTRRLPVEVEIRDPNGRLRPGLVARFEVETGSPRDVLTMDADAAFERFEVTQVYVVDADGVARRRTVSLGPTVDGRAEVVRGLEAGERVVVDGQDRVLDGAPVSVIAPEPEPEPEPELELRAAPEAALEDATGVEPDDG